MNAVITGGGSGLGAAIAAAFDGEGVSTTVLGRGEEKLAAVAASLEHGDYRVLDITDGEAVAKVFSDLGVVDVLVNNAGISPSAPFARLDQSTWRDTFAVNVDGAFLCTQAVIGGMLQRGSGRIINIASTSALKGYSYVAAYCASKHALLGLTRALAAEYASTPLTFNAVCPGFAATEMLEESVTNIIEKTGRSDEDARRALSANNPQKRFIEPDEVAATVLWLASEAARSVTGQAISVSGGETV